MEGNTQTIKNYKEAKSVVQSYLDTISTLAITEINHKNCRKNIIYGGSKKALNYRKKVKMQKSGILREEINIYNDNTTIGYIVLYNKDLFYAKVWHKVSQNRTDMLTITKEEYTTSLFLENSFLNEKYFKLK
jgi:hypothetical protein